MSGIAHAFIQGARSIMPSQPGCGGTRGVRGERVLLFRMVPHADTAQNEIVLDDVRLVREMAAGKSAALGKFYDRWSRDVYNIAISIVRVPQDAEEVVEDTFWQAYNQSARFDAARGQVRSWLMNIARSRSLDRLKSVKRRREETLEAIPVAKLADVAATDQGVYEEERTAEIAKALKELPAAQRETLEMAYYGGLSQTEIAKCTGEAIGTVKTRMRLGMQKLRERMLPSREAIS